MYLGLTPELERWMNLRGNPARLWRFVYVLALLALPLIVGGG
jgi:hypothetical protein